MNKDEDNQLIEALREYASLPGISKADVLQAVRDGVKEAMPKLNRERLYEVISEAIENGVRGYLKERKEGVHRPKPPLTRSRSQSTRTRYFSTSRMSK